MADALDNAMTVTIGFHDSRTAAAARLSVSETGTMTVAIAISAVTIAADPDIDPRPLNAVTAVASVRSGAATLGRGGSLCVCLGLGNRSGGLGRSILFDNGTLRERSADAKKQTGSCDTNNELFHCIFLGCVVSLK